MVIGLSILGSSRFQGPRVPGQVKLQILQVALEKKITHFFTQVLSFGDVKIAIKWPSNGGFSPDL